MEKELPLFPLNLIVFPGESLNLHIFEPRYKQLINDCLQMRTNFGIPSYVNNSVEYGTVVEIVEVTKLYPDGKMDIKTRGIEIFKVLDFQNPWKDRLYAGGDVMVMAEDEKEDPELNLRLHDLSQELFSWLQVEQEIKIDYKTPLYDFIHKLGLKIEEEYELLKMCSDIERKQYIIKHLKEILPVLERTEQAKEKIRMNGHFKNLDPLKF
ncbi:MAG: LON peptidase substrate-binding domain-containing protein [Cyclobacteriaceae bacterium]